MAGYIYCMSNPSAPGLIRVDQSVEDPREQLAEMGAYGRARRIDWMIRVQDPKAALQKLQKALTSYAEGEWPGQYRCKPVRARGIAIQFTEDERRKMKLVELRPPLPAIVLALGLAVQFVSMMNGKIGPSPALIVAALFWVVYTLPIGSGGKVDTE